MGTPPPSPPPTPSGLMQVLYSAARACPGVALLLAGSPRALLYFDLSLRGLWTALVLGRILIPLVLIYLILQLEKHGLPATGLAAETIEGQGSDALIMAASILQTLAGEAAAGLAVVRALAYLSPAGENGREQGLRPHQRALRFLVPSLWTIVTVQLILASSLLLLLQLAHNNTIALASGIGLLNLLTLLSLVPLWRSARQGALLGAGASAGLVALYLLTQGVMVIILTILIQALP